MRMRPIPVAQNSMRLLTRAGKLRRQAGQALVELAFVVPVLVLLVIGVIEIGRYAYISILVGNAARAGAAYGARNLKTANDTTGIATAANNDFLSNGQGPSNGQGGLSVTSNQTCGCDVGGTIASDTTANCTPATPPVCTGHWVVTVHVTASGTFSGLFTFLGANSIAISRTASVRAAPIPG